MHQSGCGQAAHGAWMPVKDQSDWHMSIHALLSDTKCREYYCVTVFHDNWYEVRLHFENAYAAKHRCIASLHANNLEVSDSEVTHKVMHVQWMLKAHFRH